MGVMMSYFAKYAYTTMDFFKWNEKKIIKIWLILFVLGIVLTFAFSQGAIFQLSQTEIPEASAGYFQDWRSMLEFSLGFFFLPLLLLVDIHTLVRKRISIVLYLFTFLFAAIFTYKNMHTLTNFFLEWESRFGLLKEGELSDMPKLWVHISAYAFLTFFNAMLMWWGSRK